MNQYAFMIPIALSLLVGAMSPGPSFIVVARNALRGSRGAGFITAVGTALGAALFAAVAASGVWAVREGLDTWFVWVQRLGGGYLIYLGVKLWFAPTAPIEVSDERSGDTNGFSALVQGLSVQLSNPKTIIVIASIFAAFMPSSPPRFTVGFATLLAFVIDFAWYAFVAFLITTHAVRRLTTGRTRMIDRVAGACLLTLGIIALGATVITGW